MKDTLVGVSGNEIITQMHDTIFQQGPMRLMIRNGIVDCKTDSLTLVIRNLVQMNQNVAEARSLRATDTVSVRSVTERTIPARTSLIRRAAGTIWNALACVGVFVILRLLIISMLKKSIL
jgi:hypothetical protein